MEVRGGQLQGESLPQGADGAVKAGGGAVEGLAVPEVGDDRAQAGRRRVGQGSFAEPLSVPECVPSTKRMVISH